MAFDVPLDSTTGLWRFFSDYPYWVGLRGGYYLLSLSAIFSCLATRFDEIFVKPASDRL